MIVAGIIAGLIAATPAATMAAPARSIWRGAVSSRDWVVDPDRAGEASGVVLTFLVTFGGIGLAGAASIIGAFEHAGHGKNDAYETTLLIFALLSLAASLIVMVLRRFLVRRGLMKPLSMAADQPASPARPDGAVAAGHDIPVCYLFPACDLGRAQYAPGACSSDG
jgi:hypothetical protein